MTNLWMFLQQTAAASLAALFLLLLQRLFLDKLSPRWQYGVWLVLLLRLLVPAGFGGRSTVLDVSLPLEALRTWVELGLSSAYSSPFVSALPAAPVPLPPEGTPSSWTDWAFLLYLAGAVLWALWFVFCAYRLSRRVGQGVPVEGARREAIAALAHAYSLPLPTRIVECRWARSPFLTGAFRSTLVLPMDWELDGKVLLHELLHLKYRDVWAGWLTTALRCLHWCNPFLWLVFDKIGNDRESLCDQRVLERLEGEDRRDYGRCLLAMADDRAMRTPGATTMANGAKAVKARIEAIARFKRFPQGMGLVSGCIVCALSLALVAGVPVSASGSDVPVEAPDQDGIQPELVGEVLALASRNRATTVAGALDAYGKGEYHRFFEGDYDELLCWAISAPREDLPAILEQWEREVGYTDQQAYELTGDGWRTGPVFRGLVSDGGDGYLCQVFWFQDCILDSADDPLWPEEDEDWPVEYLCHTVHIQPDGPYWTVEKLAETQGLFDGETLFSGLERWSGSQLYGPVTWSGEAGGLKIELSPSQTMSTGDGVLGEENLRRFQTDSGEFDPYTYLYGADQDAQPSDDPMPHLEGFTGFYSGLVVSRENTGDRQHTFIVEIIPRWDDPQIITMEEAQERHRLGQTEETYLVNRAAHTIQYEYDPLDAGEKSVFSEGGAGGNGNRRGSWTGPIEQYIAPDYFTVTVTNMGGEEFTVDLTPRYTTPDGGTFTLP